MRKTYQWYFLYVRPKTYYVGTDIQKKNAMADDDDDEHFI